MENKDAQGLSTDLEVQAGNPESGSISSDQELQRLQEDVEKAKAASRHSAAQEDQTSSNEAV